MRNLFWGKKVPAMCIAGGKLVGKMWEFFT